MIKFDDALSIAQQIEGEIDLELISVVYNVEDKTFYAVYGSHVDLPVQVAITSTNIPIDEYIANLQ